MGKVIFVGLVISLVLAVLLSPFASQSPDGLERVAEDKGFLEKAEGKEIFNAPLPDYQIPGVKTEGLSAAIAGAIGTILVFAVTYIVGYIIKKRKTKMNNQT